MTSFSTEWGKPIQIISRQDSIYMYISYLQLKKSCKVTPTKARLEYDNPKECATMDIDFH